MTEVFPTTGREGVCPWMALESSQRTLVRGWASSGFVVSIMLAGLAALAFPAPQPEAFVVTLTAAPSPVAPALTAMTEPPPEVMPDPVPDLAQPAVSEAPPQLAQVDSLPVPLDMPGLPLPEPKPDNALRLESTAAPLMKDATADPKPQAKPKPKPKKTKTSKQSQPESQPVISAPVTSARVTGSLNPKAWASAVVKKIRKTSRRPAIGRGTVQIGFTIGMDGRLTTVKVMKSSGNPQIDAMGLDHVRRAAPFPPPPADANRNLAFAFEQR